MMKSIFLTLAVALFALTSCNEDDLTGRSTMQPTLPYPGISLNEVLPVGLMMEEKDTVMTFTFSMSAPQTVEVLVRITVDPASTTTEGDDFVLSTHNVVIPPLSTTGSFSLEIFGDNDPEGVEELIIHVGDNATANAEFTPQTMSITLTNFELPTMDILIDWEGSFEFAGLVFPICPNVDIDPTALADMAGTYSLSDDWGACPEQFSAVGDGLPTNSQIAGSNIVWDPDTYLFYADLYSNGLFGYGLGAVEYPCTMTVTRAGVTAGFQFVQRDDQVFNGDDPGYAQDGNGSQGLLFVLVIEAGNVYKFYDPVNDDLLLTTRVRDLLDEAHRVKSASFPGHSGELIR